MSERFSSFLSNGDEANVFRFTEVEPALSRREEIVFDFSGVTNMTTSFANGLVATLLAHHPEEFTRLVRFQNCDPVVKTILLGAIALGRKEHSSFV